MFEPTEVHELSDTEFRFQNRLFNEFVSGRGHDMCAPNIHLFTNESDFVTVTRAGYLHEYEIKLTRSDYKRDRKKLRHKHLSGEMDLRWTGKPAQFWFVTPPELIDLDELPEYAGLIEIADYVRVIRQGPG